MSYVPFKETDIRNTTACSKFSEEIDDHRKGSGYGFDLEEVDFNNNGSLLKGKVDNSMFEKTNKIKFSEQEQDFDFKRSPVASQKYINTSPEKRIEHEGKCLTFYLDTKQNNSNKGNLMTFPDEVEINQVEDINQLDQEVLFDSTTCSNYQCESVLQHPKDAEFVRCPFWGLGIGDWGLGIGPMGPIPNPQSPIPNPQNFPNVIFLIY